MQCEQVCVGDSAVQCEVDLKVGRQGLQAGVPSGLLGHEPLTQSELAGCE